MTSPLTILSLLHEDAANNSATRLFRSQPVLFWTLSRLVLCDRIGPIAILCWDDQHAAVASAVGSLPLTVSSRGPRVLSPAFQAVTAASKWLDGWRGGLLQTCDFDRGFHAPFTLELISDSNDSVLLIDPASALVDPLLLTSLLQHADSHTDENLIFSQAAPGLSGTLIRLPLLERLASPAPTHAGRALAYLQDHPGKDPIALHGCAPVPTPLARTTHRFKLDSHRQIRTHERTLDSLNGQLIHSGAADLLRLSEASRQSPDFPRDITLELTTRRSTQPIFSPLHSHDISRPDLTLELAKHLFDQLAGEDDIRLTLAGLGDPLLHPELPAILSMAKSAGVHSIHVETDLMDTQFLTSLPGLGVDIVSIHLPAVTAETYAKVMGANVYLVVLENLKTLLLARQQSQSGVPILVPTFTKLRENLAEMELFYDQWLRVLTSAVIRGPSSQGGFVPAEEIGIPHMEPPNRRPCNRLFSRMTILSDGSIPLCEESHNSPIARLADQPIKTVWNDQFHQARQSHLVRRWDSLAVCRSCVEWHRP